MTKTLSTNIVSVRFRNYPTPSGVDIPGAVAIADDWGEWRLSENEILNALKKPDGELVGWSYELATRIEYRADGDRYSGFEPRISFERPTVPEKSMRNLVPVYK